jgi:hypothetical protein
MPASGNSTGVHYGDNGIANARTLDAACSFKPSRATCDDRVTCERGLVVCSENDDAIYDGFA